MDILSERNAELLLQGANICGSMKEGYFHAEEKLYVDEAAELREFCEWVDDNVGGCARGNISTLFMAWKQPHNPELQAFVKELKLRIEDLRSRIA